MIHITDLQKVYFFYFIGLCAGYLGTFDKVNILIITLPTLLLIKNANFEFQTYKIKMEKQKSINLILSLLKDGMDLARQNQTLGGVNIEELKLKLMELFQNFFNGMGIPNMLISNLLQNMQRN